MPVVSPTIRAMFRCYWIGCALLVLTCTLSGCGGSESGTKLPEAEQQKQIQELNQQRVDEWGNKAK